MTDLLLKESLNPFYISALNLNYIKADIRGIVYLPYYLNK